MSKNSIFFFDNYRDFLTQEISSIRTHRKTFSIRAMAKHLEMGSTTLTEVLSGKKKLSLDFAFKISQRLKLSTEETDYFLLLAMHESSKDEKLKKHLQTKIKFEKKSFHQRSKLNLKDHSILSWKNAVILSLASSFKSITNEQISKVLNISLSESTQLLMKLCELKLLESHSANSFTPTHRNYLLESKNKNQILTNYYSELINKTLKSLHKDAAHERVLGSEVLTFNSKHLSSVEKIINNCLDKIAELSESLQSSEVDSIYLANTQFIRLGKVTL